MDSSDPEGKPPSGSTSPSDGSPEPEAPAAKPRDRDGADEASKDESEAPGGEASPANGSHSSGVAPREGGSGGDRPRRAVGPYDVVLSLLFIVFWLAPITWVGATKKETPGMPAWLRHQHRVSCLFINEVKGWQTYALEVQRGGSGTWEEMSEENYFELPVFGYRSRLHRVLGHSYKRGKGAQRLREVGRYIKDRYDFLNPEGPSLDALRYVRIYMNNQMLSKQTGHFKPMRPEDVPDNYVVYFGELRFDGKRATNPGWGSTRKPSKPAKRPTTTSPPVRPVATTPPSSTDGVPTSLPSSTAKEERP